MLLEVIPNLQKTTSNIMSTSETMWDDDDQPQHASLGNSASRQFSMEQEEVFLKRKSALLEEFSRNGGMEPRAVEDRIQILHDRISLLEADLTSKGKWDSARRYIQHAPRTDFDAVNRDDFMVWMGGVPFATRHAQISHNEMPSNVTTPRLVRYSHNSQSQSSIIPSHTVARHREESPSSVVSHRSKRPRTTDNEKSPCLRCKILKKRCDSLEQCSHCPEQSFDNESDFWKVLGCYRGHFREFSAIICPLSTRSTTRVLPQPDGSTKIVNFVLTRSKVSEQKRRRILHFAHTNSDFSILNHAAWDDVDQRIKLVTAASSLDQLEDENVSINLENYEASWAVLQAIYMDPIYLGPTRYNFFRLIRLGNGFSALDMPSWEIFAQAKRLLRQSVEIYLLERLCGHIASGEMTGPTPFFTNDSSPSNLVRVDIKDDMEKFLRDMELLCAGRGKLTGYPQLACFFAILVFGVAKSILIDAYSLRELYAKDSTWKKSDAMAINSVYKALVSAFCWASKSDVILQECGALPENHTHNELWGTCSMVRHDQWEEWGIKGTKEFLLGLGSSVPSETVYNGFFPQKFGSCKSQSPRLNSVVFE